MEDEETKLLCVICHDDNNDTPFAGIEDGCYQCKCTVHARCMTKWLVSPRGNGRCPHCRAQIRPCTIHTEDIDDIDFSDSDIDFEEDDLVQYGQTSWINPFGYIDVNLTDTTAIASVHTNDGNDTNNGDDDMEGPIEVTIVKEEELADYFVTWDDNPDRANSVAVVINEDYQYIDSMNVPPGWILRVHKEGQETRSFVKINTMLVAEL